MAEFLLDTGPLVALLNGRPGAVALIQPLMLRHEVTTSIIVVGECLEYAAGRPDPPAWRLMLIRILKEILPHAPSFAIVDRYAALRRSMRPPHGSGLIGDVDTLIAATALEHDQTLVTNDGDFARVPGLNVMLLQRGTFAPLSPPRS
jgi:predicted nucleic acid-binding protein